MYLTKPKWVYKNSLGQKGNYDINLPVSTGIQKSLLLNFNCQEVKLRGLKKFEIKDKVATKLPCALSQNIYRTIKSSLENNIIKPNYVIKHLIGIDHNVAPSSIIDRHGPLITARSSYRIGNPFREPLSSLNEIQKSELEKSLKMYKMRILGEKTEKISYRALNQLLWGRLFVEPLIHMLTSIEQLCQKGRISNLINKPASARAQPFKGMGKS
jgi:hypothetical protein